MQRLQQLTSGLRINPFDAAAILRNPYGINGSHIGWGNEDALNQFIAHHGVIFKPAEYRMWVSTAPYQTGRMICFDLKDIFDGQKAGLHPTEDIAADSALIKDAIVPYQRFKAIVTSIKEKPAKWHMPRWKRPSASTRIIIMVMKSPEIVILEAARRMRPLTCTPRPCSGTSPTERTGKGLPDNWKLASNKKTIKSMELSFENIGLEEYFDHLQGEELERFHTDAVRSVLTRVNTYSPYYRRLFKDIGFNPEALHRPVAATQYTIY